MAKQLWVNDNGSFDLLDATSPTITALADIAAAAAANPGSPGVVEETGQTWKPETVGSDDYALGQEYVLFSYGTPTALSASSTVIGAKLPDDRSVKVASYEVQVRVATTNDIGNNWDVKFYVDDSEMDTFNTDTGDPDEWITQRITNLGVLNEEARRVSVQLVKHGDPGNIEVYAALRVKDVVAAL